MPEPVQSPASLTTVKLQLGGISPDTLLQAIRKSARWRETIKLETLAQMGYRRSEQAQAAGYYCIRPHVSGYGVSYPGLWVAPLHFAALNDLAEEIRAKQAVAQQKAEEAARKLQMEREAAQKRWLAERQAELDRLVTERLPYIDTLDRDWLAHKLVNGSTQALGSIKDDQYRALLNAGRRNWAVESVCQLAPARYEPVDRESGILVARSQLSVTIRGKVFTWPVSIRMTVAIPGWQRLLKDICRQRPDIEAILAQLDAVVIQTTDQYRQQIEDWLGQVETRQWGGWHTDWYPDAHLLETIVQQFLTACIEPENKPHAILDERLDKHLFHILKAEVKHNGFTVEQGSNKIVTRLPIRSPGLPDEAKVNGKLALKLAGIMMELRQGPKDGLNAFLNQKFQEMARQHEATLQLGFDYLCRNAGHVSAATEADKACHAAMAQALHHQIKTMDQPGRHIGELVTSTGLQGWVCKKLDKAGRKARQQAEKSRIEALLKPHSDYIQQFPAARAAGRKLVAYLGPTNSGKTWMALNRLAEAASGAYLGPLRLLALEGQEELEKRGCTVSLVTGEERDIKPTATHVASTVEMADLQTPVDCVVIDEIQMLGDPERGAGWVQALVGMPAREVILTGSGDVEYVLQQISHALGEPLEIHHLDRQTPLTVLEQPVPLSKVEPGTAIIAFSRNDVLRLQKQLPAGVTSAVIYGNLGPAVRRIESERFRTGEAQVLIATDAVAYGLNLPIKTVLFSTAHKYIDGEHIRLDSALVHQIAGRAGRFGMHEAGFVGALDTSTLAIIRGCLSGPPRQVRLPLNVRPGFSNLLTIQKVLGGEERIEHLLRAYCEYVHFDPALFRNIELGSMHELASIADQYPDLSLRKRFTLACAPVDTYNNSLFDCFQEYVDDIGQNREIYGDEPGEWMQAGVTDDNDTLFEAETQLKKYDLYVWLAYHFPELFKDVEQVRRWRTDVNKFISKSLAGGIVRRCRSCGAELPAAHVYPNCDRCFRSRRRYWDYDEEDFDVDDL